VLNPLVESCEFPQSLFAKGCRKHRLRLGELPLHVCAVDRLIPTISRGAVMRLLVGAFNRPTCLPAEAADRLGRLPNGPQEGPPHSLPVREADFVRDHIHR